MNDYYQIEIPIKTALQNEIIIACLADAGYEGFEEEDCLLRAFIAKKDYSESTLTYILKGQDASFTRKLIPHENWNQQWEEGFSPVVVHDFCAVRASFHPPMTGVKHELIITPKMSFGTGHHATTYMMIEAISTLPLRDKSVLDFGTGTGVLAILAEKMGASVIHAIDNDAWSIENGKENIQHNQCKNIRINLSDSLNGLPEFDVVLANINKNIILEHLPMMHKHLLPGAIIVFSGLLVSDLDDILRATEREGWQLVGKQEKNGWICLGFINTEEQAD